MKEELSPGRHPGAHQRVLRGGKIAGVKMCQAYHRQYGACFISALPTNLYGPGDNFDPRDAHVIPAMIREFHEAQVKAAEVVMWGTGAPRREFLYVDDLADACLFLMQCYGESDIINVGVGQDLTIGNWPAWWPRWWAIRVGWPSTPATPKAPPKLLDVTRLTALGWQARTGLREGLEKTYEWFCQSPGPGNPESEPVAPAPRLSAPPAFPGIAL